MKKGFLILSFVATFIFLQLGVKTEGQERREYLFVKDLPAYVLDRFERAEKKVDVDQQRSFLLVRDDGGFEKRTYSVNVQLREDEDGPMARLLLNDALPFGRIMIELRWICASGRVCVWRLANLRVQGGVIQLAPPDVTAPAAPSAPQIKKPRIR